MDFISQNIRHLLVGFRTEVISLIGYFSEFPPTCNTPAVKGEGQFPVQSAHLTAAPLT